MTTMATDRPGSSRAHAGENSRSGVRVAVREIREAAFRALIAAGASGGEAATAAELVVLGEVLDGEGILALVDELDRVPRGRAPLSRDEDTLAVLQDPAHRGPLLLGPPAAELAAAGGRPVLLPRATWTPAVVWNLIGTAARTTTPLVATQVRADATAGGSALATPDGAVYQAPHPGSSASHPYLGSALAAAVAHGGGVLLSRWTGDALPTDLMPARSSAQHEVRFTAAMRNGLWVAPGPWTTLHTASRQFLVPEPDHVPAP
ncbi:hypothetical protein ACFVTY_03535 [Streptomyces sp. NPDC058067]|uniref:hypothetical protein n=1 Tax=Streptomyces sp. NPDC058067 TaxID=3346324 RepID=UPI0036EFE9B3